MGVNRASGPVLISKDALQAMTEFVYPETVTLTGSGASTKPHGKQVREGPPPVPAPVLGGRVACSRRAHEELRILAGG